MISNNHHSSGSAWTNLSGLELPNLRNMIQSSKKEFNTNTQLSDFSLFSVGNSIPGSLNHCSTNKDFTDYSQDVSFNHCNRNSRASSSKASNESLPMNWMIDSASVSSRDEFELSKDSSLGIDQWLSLPSESIEFSAEARFECLSPRDRIIEVLSNPMLDCSQIEKVVVMKYKAKMVEELNLQKQSLWAQPAPVPNVSGKKFLPRCKFCYNNNEEDVYHNFKNGNGDVVCPILSKHVCEMCGATGSKAHTRKYCPRNPLTRGCPEQNGFPPGMIPKDVYAKTLKALHYA